MHPWKVVELVYVLVVMLCLNVCKMDARVLLSFWNRIHGTRHIHVVSRHACLSVHVIRLQRFNSTVYKGASDSYVDVLRSPETSIFRELTLKSCKFYPLEAVVEIHTAAKTYNLYRMKVHGDIYISRRL